MMKGALRSGGALAAKFFRANVAAIGGEDAAAPN